MENMSSQTQLIISIISVVIGLIFCFFGLKLVRVLTVIAGLIFGGALGLGIGLLLDVDETVGIVIAIVGAVLFGILFFVLRRVGMFFLAFLMSAAACAVVLFSIYAVAIYEGSIQESDYQVFIFIGLGISLIVAILAAIFMEPLIIIVTAVQGGLTAGLTGAGLFGIETGSVPAYVIAIVLVALGMWLQFWMHSRKIGKEEAAYAEKMRQENSIESEVEQARSLLNDDDEEDEDDEDR